MQVTRKRAMATAIDLIEREGAQAVSMRALATGLGCGLLALYDLVPSVDALLDGIADELASRIEVTKLPGAGWAAQIRAQARALRRVAASYPRCLLTVAGRMAASGKKPRPADSALATLRAAGFSEPEAGRMARAVVGYVVGSVAGESGTWPGPADRPGRDADFEFGLDLLVQAIGARYQAAAGAERRPA